MKKRFPHVTPHCFTASEVQTMAQVAGITIEEVLKALMGGRDNARFPGGGAEVLSDRVRQKLAHKKGGAEKWLEVHRAAHKLWFKSTATMMYGHVETPDDIVEHWDRIRTLTG
jgi:cyclic dehypoxanthinyl futalosine synthase